MISVPLEFGRYKIRAAVDEESEQLGLEIERYRHGLTNTSRLERKFFESAEYRTLVAYGARISVFAGQSLTMTRGDKSEEVSTFKEGLEWLMTQAKKGLYIQRYKGLGEMNPDQLWETTMDPASRRLMQVSIDDGVAADDTFTMLMGDQVEPRREFIEQNAFNVSNLDV